MTPEALTVKSALDAFIQSEAADMLGYLKGRWSDEHEYEDWNEYAKKMKEIAPKGFTFVKATRSPFGMQVTHRLFPNLVFQIRATNSFIGYKATKK